MNLKITTLAAITVILMFGLTPATAAPCESLASLALPNTTITLAQAVPAGTFTPPGAAATAAPNAALVNLPAFCRIAATLKPTNDSDIKIEVWLPATNWNGKFEAVGNGGWAGVIGYPAMGLALKRNYATASTDTGHVGANGSFALGHPEKLEDFAYRAIHEMTVHAKTIVDAFYGNRAQLSYFNGCSTGGRQALKEAQRFPSDFDGIIAGAPANYWTHLAAHSIWISQAVHKDEASYIPPAKYQAIHEAAVGACDAGDGIKDGILEDPARCKFDPKVLECKGADAPSCLTPAQVEAARKIYAPATNPRTSQQVYPPLMPGSELAWNGLAGPQPFGVAADYWKYVQFKDPNWDARTLNFDADIAAADKMDNGLINATDPNLKAFFAHGGKLLQYHGWTDQLISPENSINYYNSVLKAMGGTGKVQASYRLFMAPGMNHCAGGEGPNIFDSMTALDQWVEKGKPPDQIIASHSTDGKVDRTRPLCPYPQVAKYKGNGSTDDAANFVCGAP